MVSVGGDWERLTGRPWTPEDAAVWIDWVHRKDLDRFVKGWIDSHRRGTPMILGCRATWPNGMTLDAKAIGMPIIRGRTFDGFTGITRFKLVG